MRKAKNLSAIAAVTDAKNSIIDICRNMLSQPENKTAQEPSFADNLSAVTDQLEERMADASRAQDARSAIYLTHAAAYADYACAVVSTSVPNVLTWQEASEGIERELSALIENSFFTCRGDALYNLAPLTAKLKRAIAILRSNGFEEDEAIRQTLCWSNRQEAPDDQLYVLFAIKWRLKAFAQLMQDMQQAMPLHIPPKRILEYAVEKLDFVINLLVPSGDATDELPDAPLLAHELMQVIRLLVPESWEYARTFYERDTLPSEIRKR